MNGAGVSSMRIGRVANRLLEVADLSSPLCEGWGTELGPDDWKMFITVARRQRILGVAACRINAEALATAPDEEREQLQRARHGNRLRALNAFREVDRIVTAFAAEDMPCVPFKGADLARRVYPDPAMRPFEDLDLLLREQDLSKATRVMGDLGYAVPSSLLPAGLVRTFHFHLPMVHARTGMFVELHWRLADRHTLRVPHEDLLEQARPERGSPRRVLPADIYVVYLCAHLGKHGYLNQRIARHEQWKELLLHPWSELRLIWFVDLHLLMRRHDLSPDTILVLAETYGCAPATRTVLELCGELFPDFQALASTRQGLEREGYLERRIKDRLVSHMRRDISVGRGPEADLPWLLRTHKLIHVRPVRFLDIW